MIIDQINKKTVDFERNIHGVIPSDLWLGPKEVQELAEYQGIAINPYGKQDLTIMGLTVRFSVQDGMRIGISF